MKYLMYMNPTDNGKITKVLTKVDIHDSFRTELTEYFRQLPVPVFIRILMVGSHYAYGERLFQTVVVFIFSCIIWLVLAFSLLYPAITFFSSILGAQ